ncbi:MAG TPA: vWA domain-containing protein [Polyangia bacterium]
MRGYAFVTLLLLVGACAPQGVDPAVQSRTSAVTAAADPGNLDILFMIDNSSSMTELQMKMLAQDPSFMTVLQNLTNGLPNVHIAVVSSDMGAPGDSTSSIRCTTTGDDGVFQSAPQGTCTATTLTGGATFISNVGGVPNYTGTLESTFGCIAQLGDKGCGFEHQLAAVTRALGADGSPVPGQNAGFLRDDAVLAIVFLTNEDDCSAPTNTELFSLNVGGSNQQNIANALGPVADYRCNQFGHLCNDPTSATPTAFIVPPLTPPADAQGTATVPTLNLTNCESNDTGAGLLTPVSAVVAGIRALKADPNHQIVVGSIAPPAVPYTVAWVPEQNGQNTQPGELWPQIEHSCGAIGADDVNPLASQNPTDGSFGDPGVRIEQFVHAFGTNGVVASICDPNYGAAFQHIADRIDANLHSTASTGAAGSGGAGTSGSGSAGSAGSGAAGTTGTAGTSGSGTAGTTGAGTAGGGGHAAAGAGGAVTTGAAGSTGSGSAGTTGSGVAGTTGSGAAGTTGSGSAGTTGSGVAGTTGSGAAGTTGSGSSGATGSGAAGTTGSGAAGATGSDAAGATGTGVGGSGAASGTTGGTTTGSGGNGCSCDTGPSGPSGFGLALLLGGLAAAARRGRRPAVTSPASRRSRR